MRKALWTIFQVVALLLFLGSLPLGCLLDHPVVGGAAFLAILSLHLLELGVVLPLAKQRRFPVSLAALKTLLFGFTWWVPFRCGILER